MRVFIGFELPTEVKDYLYDVQSHLLSRAIKGNKTLYHNFHLTLIFLGEVKSSKINALSDLIEEIASSHPSFDIHIGDIGFFNVRSEYILWSKVTKGLNPLFNLYHALESLLYQENWISEKKQYKPHITLARQVKLLPDERHDMLPTYHAPIHLKEITLFESHRINDILTYTPIHHFSLKK